MCKTINCWCSIDTHLWAHLRDIPTVIGYSTIGQKMHTVFISSQYTVSRYYLFKSKIFETSQFVSHHYTHHLRDDWCRSITFQCFQSAIYGMKIQALVLDIYSPTFSPFLIQPNLHDLHDVWLAIFNSRPYAGGLSGALYHWLHGSMLSDGCHLSRFGMSFDRYFYELYDITDLNIVSKHHLKFRFCFII